MPSEPSHTGSGEADDVKSLREFLQANTDIDAALNHQFEYYVWFRGHDFRFSHWRHEEIMVRIGEFIFENHVGESGDQDSLYVFREYEIWLGLQVLPATKGGDRQRRFRMKSFTLDLADEVEFVRRRSSETTTDQPD